MIKHMSVSKILLASVLITNTLGCTAENVLTKNEVINQNNTSQVVTNVLFENDADETASYNIRKDGYVVIQFDSTVTEKNTQQ